MRKKRVIFAVAIIICVANTLLKCDAYSAERLISENAPFALTVPDGFITEKHEDGVTLVSANTLSSFIPKISVREVTEQNALEDYDKIMKQIEYERRRRYSKMRLLKKQSLLNSYRVPGWVISYLTHENVMSSDDVPVARWMYLLDYEDGRMLEIIGTAPFENRAEFGLVCDQVVNSVDLLSDQ